MCLMPALQSISTLRLTEPCPKGLCLASQMRVHRHGIAIRHTGRKVKRHVCGRGVLTFRPLFFAALQQGYNDGGAGRAHYGMHYVDGGSSAHPKVWRGRMV